MNSEYLKRYLSKTDSDVKKKRVKIPKRMEIIDDDVDLKSNKIPTGNHEEPMEDDDTPEIVGIFENKNKQLVEKLTAENWMSIEQDGMVQIKEEIDDTEIVSSVETTSHVFTPDTLPLILHAYPPRKSCKLDSFVPPRLTKSRQLDSDTSPPRRLRYDSDSSPPRQKTQGRESPSNGSRFEQEKIQRSREHKHRGSLHTHGLPSPASTRHPKRLSSPDISPPRKVNKLNFSVLRQKIKSEPHSPDVKRNMSSKRQRHDSASSIESEDVLSQSAQNPEIACYNEEERKIKEEQEANKKAIENKYKEWGRGLKQKEMRQEEFEDFEKESDKPLARYADDTDLNDQLRNAEKEGDPMIEYMRRKRAKEAGSDGKERPVYRGPEPPPNRFNIGPGYRWDGVDRSNGFEQQFYAKQNERKANKDLAYKWSTEDM